MNHRAFMKAARGVTLVELIVVVAIIAIVAAVASPSIFNTMRRESAAGVAREVANELRRARNQAMARGEIIIVQIEAAAGDDRGALTTYATTRAPYTKGGTTCNPDDADAPTFCDPGHVCLNGECWAEPARSCREWDDSSDFLRQVARLDLDTMDGPNMALRGHAPNDTRLCFSPDGRVLTNNGRTFPSPGALGCEGENFVLWVADKDATIAATTINCGGDRDERDPVNFYRISIPYNGAISVTQ